MPKRGAAPCRRGPRTQSGRPDEQAAPGLRSAGPAAQRSDHPGAAAREHTNCGGARCCRIPQQGGPGRPRKRPAHVIAGKGYSYPACRQLLRRRGIRHTIPERRDQQQRRATRSGRSPAFDAATYRRRNVVERCVNKLKQWRGIATRYEKRACNYRAMVIIAALMIWLTA